MCVGNLMVTDMYLSEIDTNAYVEARQLEDATLPQAYDALIDYRKRKEIGIPEQHLQAFALLLAAIEPGRRVWLMDANLFYVWYPGRDRQNAQSAWISPKGMVYPVNYAGHGKFYAMACNKSESLFELGGWVHVSEHRADMYGNTDLQLKALEALPGTHRKSPRPRYGTLSDEDREFLKKLDRVHREGFNPYEFFKSIEAQKCASCTAEDAGIDIPENSFVEF